MLLIKCILLLSLKINFSHEIEKCTKNCNNFLMLKNNDVELEGNITMFEAKIREFPSTIMVHILIRKIWRHITTGTNGGITKVKDVGPFPPDEIEASEWIMKKQCKIGSLCVPNGDCYGGGIDHCVGLGLNPHWVNERVMEFDNTIWAENIIFMRERCIQDWSCSIKERESLVYVNDDGKAFVNLGGKRIFLYADEYNVDKGIVFIIKNVPNYSERIEKLNCLQTKKGLWCNWKNLDTQLSVEFLDQKKCVQMRNFNICPISSRKARSVEENAITLDDAKELEFEVSKNVVLQNANNIKLQNEIYRLKNVINKIVLSVSRYNPFIIKDLTGQNVYVQKKGQYMSACPCHNLDDDCVLNTGIYSGDSKCTNPKNVKEMDIVQMTDIIELTPDDIDFRGKEEDVFETELEKEDSLEKHFVSNVDTHEGSFLNNVFSLPGFSIYASVLSILPFINLLLIVIRR